MAGFLDISGVTKAFGGLVALDGVGFGVPKGEVVSVIGPNGSGKTTLFNIVSGLLAADSGSVVLDGSEIAGRAPHRIAEMGLARTFQNARLFPNLTLLQNIELPQYTGSRVTVFDALLSSPRARDEQKAVRAAAEALLAEVGGGRLFPRRFDYPESCSLGEQRILEIIRVLAMRPSVLLMDEPTQGLNPTWVAEMLELIEDIQRRGVTILLIEHKMSVVMRLADKVVVLNTGRKIAEGTPDEVRKNRLVIQAYLGE